MFVLRDRADRPPVVGLVIDAQSIDGSNVYADETTVRQHNVLWDRVLEREHELAPLFDGQLIESFFYRFHRAPRRSGQNRMIG
jgi:hypothetical protein